MMYSFCRVPRRILIGVFLIAAGLHSGVLSADAQSIRGRVLDATTQAPLAHANVVVADTRRGTATNADGGFTIDGLPPGTYLLAAQYVGYETALRTVEVVAGRTATVEFPLNPSPLAVEEIVVRAGMTEEELLTRARQSVATLGPDVLERTRGQTLGETLKQLPGVTTMQTGPSISKPVVRGLHSQRVVVLNAGVPQEGQQWGGEHAPEIDPFAPARIEVVKGAAGVEHGVGAIGGVIQVEPRVLPTAPGFGGRVDLNGFSNSRQGAGAVLIEGAPAQVEGFAWRAQASVRKAGDAHTPDYVIGNSAFEERNGALTLGYQTARTGLKLYASRFATELGIYRGSHVNTLNGLRRAIDRDRPAVDYAFSYAIDAPKQSITHDLVSLKGVHRLPRGDRLEVQYGIQRNHRQEFDAHRRGGDPLDEPAFDLTLNTHTLDAKWRLPPRRNAFGVVGLSGMNQANVNAESGYLIPNFRALTGGAFAHGTWMPGNWTLEAGVRFDTRWMKAFPRADGAFERRTHAYRSLSGVVGGIWQFAPTWSVATNVATAWRPPSVNELYSYGVHHGTAQFEIGDATLSSERSIGVDATLRHVGDRVRLETSFYTNWMNDFIHLFPTRDTLVTIRGVFPAFQHQQAQAVLRGLDGHVEFDLRPAWAVGARASVVRGTNVAANMPLIGMPADRLVLHSTVRLFEGPRLRTSELRPELTFVRKQTRVPEGVDYAPPPAGYALVGLQYHADLQVGNTPLQVGLSIHNLFNARYRDYLSRWRYYIDEPGRTLVVRVRIPFGTAASGG